MSRWFRHYAGMMRDDKLVRVALQSKQTVERVLWVWGAILENAAELNDGGRFDVDQAEIAYFLRADEADIRAVLDGLAAVQRVAEDRVVNWSTRQFESDKSASRQAAYRERRRSQSGVGDAAEEQSDGGVTSPSRHRDAPETETETETEKKKDSSALRAPRTPNVSRGTRLPEGWTPDEAGRAYALTVLTPDQLNPEIENFTDYWKAANGPKAVKRDWSAAWRTWVRNSVKFGGGGNGQGRPRAFQDDSRSLTRAADRLIERAERGEFSFGPRPSLLSAGGSDDVRLLPKG